MTRKSVTNLVERFSVYDLDGSLNDVISRLQDYRERYGDNVLIDVDRDFYDDSFEVLVYQTRMETDAEMNVRKRKTAQRAAETRRMNREKKAAQEAEEQASLQEERERQLYEELKAKFEPSE